MGILPRTALNLIRVLCLPHLNPTLLEALQLLPTMPWNYHAEAFLPLLVAFLDIWPQHAVLLVTVVKESLHMTTKANVMPDHRTALGAHLYASFSQYL